MFGAEGIAHHFPDLAVLAIHAVTHVAYILIGDLAGKLRALSGFHLRLLNILPFGDKAIDSDSRLLGSLNSVDSDLH